MAALRPDLCDRLVLMGPGGWPTKVNENLEALWSYKPSVENMKGLMDIMAFDRTLVTDELAELRYRATVRPGAQERFEQIFPPPHQRWLDAQALSIDMLQSISNEVLIIHGRDDRVVAVILALASAFGAFAMHYIGQCGTGLKLSTRLAFRHWCNNSSMRPVKRAFCRVGNMNSRHRY